jgi:hypothetical protein
MADIQCIRVWTFVGGFWLLLMGVAGSTTRDQGQFQGQPIGKSAIRFGNLRHEVILKSHPMPQKPLRFA